MAAAESVAADEQRRLWSFIRHARLDEADAQEFWTRIRDLVEESWFCAADDDERMLRLVRRHTEFGRTPDAARAWATDVDGANARRIDPTRAHADLVVSGVTGEILEGADGERRS